MTFKRQLTMLCALVGTWVTLGSAPQVISLDSGERVVGELSPNSTDETIILQSGLLGEITIDRARVVKIEPRVVAKVVAAKVPAKKDMVPDPETTPAKKQIALINEEIVVIEKGRVLDALRKLKAPDSWRGKLRVGLNLSRGDRKWTETYVRGNLEIKPKASSNFFRFSGSYTYRESERGNGTSFKSTDKFDGSFIYRRTFYDNWFAQNSLGFRVDQIKGIGREIQEALGVGYKFKPTRTFEFLLGGGGGIEDFQADFKDTRAGLNPLLNIFQEATWRPWKRTSIVQKFNYYWNPQQTEQFNYVLTTAIRFRLTDLIGFEFSFNKNFDNDVGNGDSKDDIQWRNALVVYF